MSDSNVHNEPSSSGLLEGYLPEREAAKARHKGTRALRAERQRGSGPPYVKDGKQVLYPIEGFRAWLKANERHPVRADSPKVA